MPTRTEIWLHFRDPTMMRTDSKAKIEFGDKQITKKEIIALWQAVADYITDGYVLYKVEFKEIEMDVPEDDDKEDEGD